MVAAAVRSASGATGLAGFFELSCDDGGRGRIACDAEGGTVPQRSEHELSHSGACCQVLHRLDPGPGVWVGVPPAEFAERVEDVTVEP